jgi:hypothetical protein
MPTTSSAITYFMRHPVEGKPLILRDYLNGSAGERIAGRFGGFVSGLGATSSAPVGPEVAKIVVNAWLKSEFEPARSDRKVARRGELEQQQMHFAVSGEAKT